MCASLDAGKKGDRCTPGMWYTLGAENISRGAGSDDTVDPAVLLAPSRRVLMSSDIKTGLNKKRHLTRKVQIVLDQGTLEFPKPPPPHPLWAELAGSFGLSPMAVDIYTDGTWVKTKVRLTTYLCMVMGATSMLQRAL